MTAAVTAGRWVVLLRGVNVGGHHRLAMPAFRSLLEQIGAVDARTYLQSGNAVVSWTGSATSLQAAVEQGLRDLDLPVAALVRTSAELDAVVDDNPFAAEHLDPVHLHAVFLTGPAPELDVGALLPDRVVPGDRVLYVAYAGPSPASKVAKLLGSRRLSVASARNWRTVLALQELARR